ncbi:hypothetical protein G6F70_001933 [Rhizopus microsporus]|uniref:Mevalonate kinase n=2 Tax=Rhizopus TaxID=4842 RepID=A0A367JTM1_RHIAZ|nr:hypothetical protein G6F71_002079 [Rhizopus microsporus]RCH93322.1 hypothetical protein CU097_011744 [Rhizopus azygosporus]KAG1202790.1 hypothetical protein G6F70_001933 [Rhizopus microsporus]KAG1214423.1 hypothetical protein G6F69_001920 [Rhizopus microsporus]KAG1237100.1 hypothetical protein G6F67_001453 [Rhizopus microsporus]
MVTLNKRILISSPGKVILFGEHSVVYQKTAVAASLGLRSYLYLEHTDDNIIRINLPDIGVERVWKLEELPLGVDYPDSDTLHPSAMPAKLEQQMETLCNVNENNAQKSALMAFLYLLNIMQTKGRPIDRGFTISVRSFLPVGAGLGSSASYSVAITTALLILNDLIPVDFRQSAKCDQYVDMINSYAFRAEQVIHGNPSGVDNAVSTYGGAKTFVRGEGFATLEGFQSLRLLLTNTKVPRSTSALVAFVRDRKEKYGAIINPILDAMDSISIRCRDAFKRLALKEMTEDELMKELEDLVVLNHALLVALGVSHPSLEKVKSITEESNLKTKLTGAGGGGCAVTFIPNETSQEVVDKVMSNLKNEGFDCYQTSVGGSGANATILSGNENEHWLLNACRSELEKYL